MHSPLTSYFYLCPGGFSCGIHYVIMCVSPSHKYILIIDMEFEDLEIHSKFCEDILKFPNPNEVICSLLIQH